MGRREIRKGQMTRLVHVIRREEDAFLPLDGLTIEVVPGHHDEEYCGGWLAHYNNLGPVPAVSVYAGCDLLHAGRSRRIRGEYLSELRRQSWLYAQAQEAPADIAAAVTAEAINSASVAITALTSLGVPTRSDFVPRSIARRFRAVVLHEVGHHRLHQVLGSPGNPFLEWDSQFATHMAFEGVVPPSLYAALDPGEWFAEAYSLWRLGLPMPPGNAECIEGLLAAIGVGSPAG